MTQENYLTGEEVVEGRVRAHVHVEFANARVYDATTQIVEILRKSFVPSVCFRNLT